MIDLRATVASVSFGRSAVSFHVRQEQNKAFFDAVELDEHSLIIATVTADTAKNEPRKNTLWSKSGENTSGYLSIRRDGLIHDLGIELNAAEFDSLRQCASASLTSSQLLEIELSFDSRIERDDGEGRVLRIIDDPRVAVRRL